MRAANPDLHAEARRNALKAISPTRDAAARSRQLLLTIFAEGMKYRKQDGVQEYYENLYWCAFLLYLAGHPDDVPLIWKAKHISMDTGIGLDGQCLVGAGVEATRRMLAERNE